MSVPEVGLSVLGISHRSDWFAEVVKELEDNIRTLLGISDQYHVLFLQGGATQQFTMVPKTLLHGAKEGAAQADYIHSGYWSGKSIPEAQKEGEINVIWSGEKSGFVSLPTDNELVFSPEASYLHYVSNETVEGLQFKRVLGRDDVPRICDMSSDFLSKPCDADKFALIYAHAQKNIGPAGVTVVLVHEDMLVDVPNNLPGFLDYRRHIDAHSIYNTPPVFAIYTVLLVSRWLLHDVGGLSVMEDINQSKADLIYQILDESDGFYQGRARRADRSTMNAVFNLENPELEKVFIAEAQRAGMSGLGGHRSIGGIRASLYNGLRLEAVTKLANFMQDFQRQHRA